MTAVNDIIAMLGIFAIRRKVDYIQRLATTALMR